MKTVDLVCLWFVVMLSLYLICDSTAKELNRPYDDCINAVMDDGAPESYARVACIRGH